ncbi:hypothetical protein IWW34DRAFT_798079 [Fusarium oxysporum f. sp. albedinis]|nr:hypothetical protein IWW34DRAFT_798079 [Fusarium oxysporum f. sp. albedinis]
MRCVFIKGLPSTSYETPFPPFYIHKRRNHGLNIYISKQSAEVTTSVELPRSLAVWLMGDPKHPDAKQADPKLMYRVGTILRVRYHKLSAIKGILDGEEPEAKVTSLVLRSTALARVQSFDSRFQPHFDTSASLRLV